MNCEMNISVVNESNSKMITHTCTNVGILHDSLLEHLVPSSYEQTLCDLFSDGPLDCL